MDKRGKGRKVTCDDCFFKRNGLCALVVDKPCATFRPDGPEGLHPPRQMRFVFRQERRRQSAWEFPERAGASGACMRSAGERRTNTRGPFGRGVRPVVCIARRRPERRRTPVRLAQCVARAERRARYVAMHLRVLGKSPAWQDAGGACSGYLVVSDGVRMLLDCGSGVFGKLRAVVDYVEVDAVVVSHLHGDHILDLVPFAAGLTYAPRHQPVPVDGWPGTDDPPRPRLIAPPGARDTFRRLCAAAGMREELLEGAFRLEEYDPGDAIEVGALTVRFQPVPHFLPTHAVEVTRRRRPDHLQRRFLPERGPVHVRPRHRSAADRGHAAAPRARRAARSPDARGGRRARPARGCAAARADAHLRRAGRRMGARGGREGLRRAGRCGARGSGLHRLTA